MINKAKSRLLQFVELQPISKRKFCEKISVSESYFTKDNAVGSDVLEKVSHNYPQINMDWIITGRGEMLYNSNQKLNNMQTNLYQNLEFIRVEKLDISLEVFCKSFAITVDEYKQLSKGHALDNNLFYAEMKRFFNLEKNHLDIDNLLIGRKEITDMITLQKFLEKNATLDELKKDNSTPKAKA